MDQEFITIEGARQNNLKGLNLKFPLGKMIVITGVSGSGKSSLAFDTIYAEGQRRYVETFSSYARQFLDRMDRPKVDKIEGIPPAIAIDQTNPVRTSRSTVGTMTELNDHIKLLFARAAHLICRGCGRQVRKDTPDSVCEELLKKCENQDVIITFRVSIPANFTRDEIVSIVHAQGYTRFFSELQSELEVIQDRVSVSMRNRGRIIEDLEAAMKHQGSLIRVYQVKADGTFSDPHSFSPAFHCAACDIQYRDAVPGLFSFNSPVGACETCRGFGRVIGVDYNLVIPDWSKTLAQGVIKPWQSESYRECQDDLMRFAAKRRIPVDVPWKKMTDAQKNWVLEGEGAWEDGVWYGLRRFFEWLESKSYKMHIRVLLSRYRAYHLCSTCGGSRLKADALLWRLGTPHGLSIDEVMQLPIEKTLAFFETMQIPSDEAAEMVREEILVRLRYLLDVGLGYLTLDRQSRTLSGGEVQRINLTTALGTSLVNTLFVLDEPSIGLHSRDIRRLIGVLHKLRDAGNTLIIVEHDPELIKAADYVLDLGPGPGEHGGQAVFYGPLEKLLSSKKSITAQYLNGYKQLLSVSAATSSAHGDMLIIRGATEHNLKNIDVSIPLRKLVCITGVSGSGKSTLIQDVCYYGIRQVKGKPVETPGAFCRIEGAEKIGDVVLVDQSPIGKTTRSNPASYVGAFDAIRKLFAAQPLARERGYTAGTFSFNSGNGRCPGCSGNGFQHVEMQFLSDVYLRCPDCDGKRYRPEILDVSLGSKQKVSLHDVLQMTIEDACTFFADCPEILRGLEPLRAVGLSYMRLGQPLPTLSGGEAQRLKLAGYLASSKTVDKKGVLFLFDEPTTGLHFADIDVLMKAFRRLILSGHSVVVIEHNLDVIGGADWIIDLGPEGGNGGGELVFSGTPQEITLCKESHTGVALANYHGELQKSSTRKAEQPKRKIVRHKTSVQQSIRIRKAREHNLRNIDVTIPRDAFTVITGVSGSGKSTIAFDILFAEGQRRYLESLNAYARQFIQPAQRPDVDAVLGVPPTVAIEQRTSRGGRKSTVATVTELYHFLRLLFVKLGTQFCPDCDLPIEAQSEEAILAEIMKSCAGEKIAVYAPLVVNRKGIYNDLAKWAAGKGFDTLRVDNELFSVHTWPKLDRYREHTIQLPLGEIRVSAAQEQYLREMITKAVEFGKGTMYLERGRKGSRKEIIYSTTRSCPRCHESFEELDPRQFSFNSKHGWCPLCYGTGLEITGFDENQTGEEIWWNEWYEGGERICSYCEGKRLKRSSLSVKVQGRPINEYTALSVEEASKLFPGMKFKGRDATVAGDILAELFSRLDFLLQIGLGYMTLDRAAPTLSGGEAQRIRLAAQLGSNLRGVCYVLDEPTIGLHARDNEMLLRTLFTLKEKGNTVIVVEHDEETIKRAEHIIDLGPGGGKAGGAILSEGSINQILRSRKSITGTYLRKPLCHNRRRRAMETAEKMQIFGATLHNLKSIDAEIPLGRFVCVTGVSGSGKSTLVRDILYSNLTERFSGNKRPFFYGCKEIRGWDCATRILEVDQRPIGKTPRSCPATYVGFMDEIRKLFARSPEAQLRGYSASRFSFNVNQGRCPACEGQGIKRIEMSFLPDVNVPCETCGGLRFTPETLAVRFRDKSIAEVLAMNVDEAVTFFAAHHSIHGSLKLLQETGLGYLTLGQQSPTLSGGEAQRIKLVTELGKASSFQNARRGVKKQHTMYVLDEPTVGLHMADVDKLVGVLHRLVDAGNTVIIIEHNLDVIAEADWIVDLGPEGGQNGGTIIAQGTPEQIVQQAPRSHTAKYLKAFLERK